MGRKLKRSYNKIRTYLIILPSIFYFPAFIQIFYGKCEFFYNQKKITAAIY